MTKTFPRYCFILVFCLLESVFSQAAHAQRCGVDFELIFKMREPSVAAYSVWDSVYGHQDQQEKFVSGVVIENTDVVVAGERSGPDHKMAALILVEIDRRGRVVWEQTHQIAGLESVVKILRTDKGYLIIGNRLQGKKTHSVWLGFFDEKGFLSGEKDVQKAGGALLAHDIVRRHDGRGYLLAVSAQNGESEAMRFSMIYTLNSKGEAVSDRAYMPGTESRILGLSLAGNHQYTASGYIYGESGLREGWILRLNDEGEIIWQRQYPRGVGAELTRAQDYQDTGMVAIGNVRPGDNGLQAGWVMALRKADGDVVWQRYYTGEMEYFGRDFFSNANGLISVMFDARKPKEVRGQGAQESEEAQKEDEKNILNEYKGQNYVRLLTINPRGVLFISDEFFNGEGLDAYQMLPDPDGTRILIGATQMVYQVENAVDKTRAQARSQDGWLAAATPMEPYEDPCVRKPRYER